jgi:hypothetical protein
MGRGDHHAHGHFFVGVVEVALAAAGLEVGAEVGGQGGAHAFGVADHGDQGSVQSGSVRALFMQVRTAMLRRSVPLSTASLTVSICSESWTASSRPTASSTCSRERKSF